MHFVGYLLYHLISNVCLWNIDSVLFLFIGHWDQFTCCYLLHSALGKNKGQKESKEVSQNNLLFSISAMVDQCLKLVICSYTVHDVVVDNLP